MACDFGHDRKGAVIHLSGTVTEQDLDLIQHHFDRAAGDGHERVVLDFSQTGEVHPTLAALLGALRLQARRQGITITLRHPPHGMGHAGMAGRHVEMELAR